MDREAPLMKREGLLLKGVKMIYSQGAKGPRSFFLLPSEVDREPLFPHRQLPLRESGEFLSGLAFLPRGSLSRDSTLRTKYFGPGCRFQPSHGCNRKSQAPFQRSRNIGCLHACILRHLWYDSPLKCL